MAWFQILPINTSRLVCILFFYIAKWKGWFFAKGTKGEIKYFKLSKKFFSLIPMYFHFSGPEHHWAGCLEDPNRLQGDEAAEGARADGQDERQQHKRHQHVKSFVCFNICDCGMCETHDDRLTIWLHKVADDYYE